MKPEFIKRMKFAGSVFLVVVICGYFWTAGTSSGTTEDTVRKVDRAPLIEEMQGALIVIPDFSRPVRLVAGKAEFLLDENEPEIGQGTATLRTLTARANGMRSGSDRAREYVFGVLTVSGGGNGIFDYVLMFEDDGRGLSFITSAFIGDRIEVLALHIGNGWGDESGDVRLNVRIVDRAHGEAMMNGPTIPKVLHFRVHKANDTITKEGNDE